MISADFADYTDLTDKLLSDVNGLLSLTLIGEICVICGHILHSSDHQRAVLRSKANAVTECYVHPGFAGFDRNVIEITIGIGLVEIDRWRNQIGVHGAQSGP